MEKGLLVKDQAGGRAMAMFTAAAKDNNNNTREVQLVGLIGRTPTLTQFADIWCGDIVTSPTPVDLMKKNNFYPVSTTLASAGITPHHHMACQYFEEVLNGGDDDAVFLIGGADRGVHAVVPNWATDTDFNTANWSYTLNALPDLPGTLASEIMAAADINGILYVVDIFGYVASIDPYDPVDWTTYSERTPYYNWTYATFGDLLRMPDGIWLYKGWGYLGSGDSHVYTTTDLNSPWTLIDDTNPWYHADMLVDGRIVRTRGNMDGLAVSAFANTPVRYTDANGTEAVWQDLPTPYGTGWYDASCGMSYMGDGLYIINTYSVIRLPLDLNTGIFGTAWEYVNRSFPVGYDQSMLASQRSCLTTNKYSWMMTSGGLVYDSGWVPAPAPALFRPIDPEWAKYNTYDCKDMSKIRLHVRCDDTFDATSLKIFPVLLDSNMNPITRLDTKTITFGPLGNLVAPNEYYCGAMEWDIAGYSNVAFTVEELAGTTGYVVIYAEIF